jgi:hypothetical protein
MVEMLTDKFTEEQLVKLDAQHRQLRFVGIITKVEFDEGMRSTDSKPLAPKIVIWCEHNLNGLDSPILLTVKVSSNASDRIDAMANLQHAVEQQLPALIQAELQIVDHPIADIYIIQHADWLASHLS